MNGGRRGLVPNRIGAKTPSKLVEKAVEAAWGKELSCGIYSNQIGGKLYAWATRAHNDRVAFSTERLRAWAELVLFKWKPGAESTPVEVA